MEFIAQGAEARLYRDGETVVKDRFAKAYRHPQLDTSLRTSRTRREATILRKLPGISPEVLREEPSKLVMRHVPGMLVKDALDNDPALAHQVGRLLAQLHSKDIMHADLTTSNMILTPAGTITLIDFGLSYVSHRVEDKAVDLHLFRQALESKHVRVFDRAYAEFIAGYQEGNPDAREILERLSIVETRGRNKQSY